MKLIKTFTAFIFSFAFCFGQVNPETASLKSELEEIARELDALRAKSEKPKEESSVYTTPAKPAPKYTSFKKKLLQVNLDLKDITQGLIDLKKKTASRDSSRPSTPTIQKEKDPHIDFDSTQKKTSNQDNQNNPSQPAKSDASTETFRTATDFSNYLIISPNFNFSRELEYSSGGGVFEMDTETGMGMSLELGKSVGIFDLGILLGFDQVRLKNLAVAGTPYNGKGKVSSYKIALQPAIKLGFNDHLYLRFGTGLGISSRHDHFKINDGSTMIDIYEDNLCLLLNLHSSLGLQITEASSLFLGYRFSYLGESGNFEDFGIHAVEIGGRFDF